MLHLLLWGDNKTKLENKIHIVLLDILSIIQDIVFTHIESNNIEEALYYCKLGLEEAK